MSEYTIDISKGHLSAKLEVRNPDGTLSWLPYDTRKETEDPKNGTISQDTEDAVKKLSGGQIAFKTESSAPVIHMSVGKLSFDDKKLSENISTALSAIGASRIEKVVLKSTMSPAVRLKIASR